MLKRSRYDCLGFKNKLPSHKNRKAVNAFESGLVIVKVIVAEGLTA